MLVNLPYFLLTIFGIGLVIFVHELGHFLAARAVGIRVEAFSIGFGRRLWGFRRGPTDYKICLIPLGGYVKMAGEDPTRPTTGRPDEFGSKKVWQRVLVISAGVIMNMVFAVVAIPIAFAVGIPFDAPVIGGVQQGGPAWEAGLKAGDRVLAIDGRKVLTFEDIPHDLAVTHGPATLTAERGGTVFETQVQARDDADLGLPLIGIYPMTRGVSILATEFETQGKEGIELDRALALRQAGLDPRDQLVGLNGLPYSLYHWERELQRSEIQQAPLTLQVVRDGVQRDVTLPPLLQPKEGEEAWVVGVQRMTIRVDRVRRGGVADRLDLRPGDVLVEVNALEVNTWEQVRDALGEGVDPLRTVGSSPTGGLEPYRSPQVRLKVRREGQIKLLEETLPSQSDRSDLLDSFTLAPDGLRILPTPGGPASQAGLKAGDVLLGTDGQPLDSWEDLTRRVRSSQGHTMEFQILRGDEDLRFQISPHRPMENRVFPVLEPARYTEVVRLPVSESFAAGFTYTGRMVQRVVQTLRSIISGAVSSRHLGGVITIFQVSVSHSQVGIMRGLLFLAMVSINLAVLNILPIPVLDGGWLVFLIIEKIKGSPLSERTMGYFQWTGLFVVLGLMVYVTWNDLARLFGWM